MFVLFFYYYCYYKVFLKENVKMRVFRYSQINSVGVPLMSVDFVDKAFIT